VNIPIQYKILADVLLFTEIYIIGLVRERNISYVSPAHSEMGILTKEYLLG